MASDGALDVQLLRDLGTITDFRIPRCLQSSLRCASQGYFLELPLARGNTPLHFATYNGQVEVVKLLLKAKASVTVKDLQGRGPRLGDVMGFCFPLWQLFYFLNIEQGNWRCGDIQKGILFYDILQTQHCFRQFKL